MLDEIAIKYKTDKSSLHHNFVNFYEKHLNHLQDKPIKLFEMGVKKGSSLNMWREYFVNGKIYGADINPAWAKLIPNINMFNVDQSSKQQLTDFFRLHGKFDVIIDDGSHVMSHQQNMLEIGLQFLHEGGVFIMEDLHTSYPLYKNTHHDKYPTTSEVLERLTDVYNIEYWEHPTPNMKAHMSRTSVITKK